ncbi:MULTISPECIES: hypothetical protein [Halorubrum]|uniref:Uncharacterized protein n=1 Tax=Halorubrum ruber TaxID=2982524 RepID=A0A8T8LQH2_9EURY|nr:MULTISPECIES: hypothetical protein [Halorubrum]QUO49266.1 hypothetical protein J7656_11350 [Halorubrum ruber]
MALDNTPDTGPTYLRCLVCAFTFESEAALRSRLLISPLVALVGGIGGIGFAFDVALYRNWESVD